MKHIYLIILLALLTQNSSAQNTQLSNQLLTKLKNGDITTQKGSNVQNKFWLTPLIQEAQKNWGNLTPEAQKAFGKYNTRPTFLGDEDIVTLGNFAFHYTTNSGDPDEDVDLTDDNGNDIPDYIENMAEVFENVAEIYHEEMEFAIPPNDEDEHSGAYYDIYVSGRIANEGSDGFVYGWVSADGWETSGDNPNTTNEELNASFSYMAMRNNYVYEDIEDPDKALRVTAAHEYAHAIQNGYELYMESWFKEACATWCEEFVFPGFDDNFQYLPELFGKPDVSLNFENGELDGEHDGHWYGMWLFIQYLTEQTDNSIIKPLYEQSVSDWENPANMVLVIDEELSNNWSDKFESFDDLFGSFVLANVIMESSSIYDPYTYTRADDYLNYISEEDFYIEHTFEFNGEELFFDSENDGNNTLMHLSYDPFELSASENFSIELAPFNEEADLQLALIKLNEADYEIEIAEESIINVEDNEQWTTYFPIVVRFDIENFSTESEGYELIVSGEQFIETSTVSFIIGDEEYYLEGAEIEINSEVIVTDANGEASIELEDGEYEYYVNYGDYNEYAGKITVEGEAITEEVVLTTVEINALKLINVQVYPNPASTYLNISIHNNTSAIAFLTDITGREILKTQINHTKQIDVTQLVSGSYILKCMQNGVIVNTNKIIIK